MNHSQISLFSSFSRLLPLALMALAAQSALAASPPSPALNNCEGIRAGIENRVRANGVKDFSVTVVDANASAAGKVVGSCERGSKKIIYTVAKPAATASAATPAPAAAPGAAAAKPAAKPVMTECADGRVVKNGDCRK